MSLNSGGWSSRLLGKTSRKRTRVAPGKCDQAVPANEVLETRILPAVDLILSTATINITGDPAVGSNQYSISLLYKMKNLGTTPIDVTGVAGDPSDNVRVQVYGSLDSTLDGGDTPAFSFDFDLVDNGSHLLNQNDEAGAVLGTTFLARQTLNFLILKVDYNNAVTESNETNNTFVLNVQNPTLKEVAGTSNIGPKQIGTIHNDLTVRDLNTTNFLGGNFGITIDGAQAREKFFLKDGVGAERLRIAGSKLKLGAQKIGTVTKVLPNDSNGFQMSLQVEFTGDVSRDTLNRVLRNLSFKTTANSTGDRTAHIQVKDNLENFTNVIDRTIHVT